MTTLAVSRTRSRSRSVAIGALALIVAVAACGDDDDGGGGVATDPAVTAVTAASDADTTGGSTDTPAGDPDATLSYGAANALTRFDPHRSSNGYDQNYLAPVYERLIHQTPEAELEPGLATEWAFVDETTFDMTLREGVVFADGTPFDADAVVANIDRAKNVEGSGVAAYLASVDEVEAVDATHVRFLLSRPDATLPNQLATRPGMMMSPAILDAPDVETNPVGTGPYVLAEYRANEVAVYERNPDYWDADYQGPARLEIFYFPDAVTRLNALRSGQIDAAPIDLTQIEDVQAEGQFTVDVTQTIETYHFQLDRTQSEFGDVRVRRALSHAIDRDGIVESLMQGFATAATQWVAPGTPLFLDDLGESTTYDPELSRQLLAEAGLADGFTFQAMVSVQPIFIQLSEVLQAQFAEIGVTREVEQSTNLADAFFVQNAADAIVSAYPGRMDPSETAQIYFNSESFSNPGRQIDAEVEAAWVASLVPSDDRTAAQQDLLRAIDDAMPNVPILYPQVGLAYGDNVQGLAWYRSGHIEFEGVAVTG